MVTEDYVSFETAKLLKEKGFDEPCECFYDTEHNDISIVNGWMDTSNSQLEEREFLCYSAPTLQMAMKWLREVHKIDITVDPHEVANNWIYQFHLCQNKNYLFSKDIDTSYEICAEAAIKYCLENLI